MSSHCWSLPHSLSSSPQHEEPPGQHDLPRDDTVYQELLPPLPETTLSGSSDRSESSAGKPLTSIMRVPRNLRPNSPTFFHFVSCCNSWACLSAFVLLMTDWRPNRGSIATIPAAVSGLVGWLHSPRSQVVSPSHLIKSSQHTPINFRLGRNSFHTDFHDTQESEVNLSSDSVHRQAVESDSSSKHHPMSCIKERVVENCIIVLMIMSCMSRIV